MVVVVAKSNFARWQREPSLGQRVPIPQPDGPPIDVTVAEVTESQVTVDFNHPLAGEDLSFDIKLVEIV
jgi:peptidylprolyl isomerase